MSHAESVAFESLVSTLGAMPEDHLDALASEIERSERTLDQTRRDQLASLVPDIWRVHINALVDMWVQGCGPENGVDLALVIRSVGRAYRTAEANEVVQLVWTGPDHLQSTFRRTDRAWVEVIGEAKRALWVATYSTFPGKLVNKAIEEAVDNGVSVHVIVERPVDNPHLKSTGFNKFSEDVRQSAEFLAWPASERTTEKPNQQSSMHAKCVVADKRVAFVTSANLTDAALERNIEVGILLRGGPQPGRLVERFEAMRTAGVLVPFKP